MHNSLGIRALLKVSNADPLSVGRRDPHRLVAPDPNARPRRVEFRLKGTWRVSCAVAARQVASLIEDDVADFLSCMGIPADPDASNTIAFALAEDLGERDCRLTISRDSVRVEGGGISGLWAGVAWLEWEMRTRRGPMLPIGVRERRAAWSVQISQGPWGGNYSVPDFSPEYLSDDSFRLYAHYGVNSMMIYGDLLCYTRSRILPELDCPQYDEHIAMLKDAAARARRYGVRFSYLVVGPKLRGDHPVFLVHADIRGAGFDRGEGPLHFLCSSKEKTLAFYREQFALLISEVPDLLGLILIIYSESLYHCRIWDWAQFKCERCEAQAPNDVVAGVVKAVRDGVRQVSAEPYVAAWVYTWSQGDRRELFRNLPPDVAIFHAVEKDEQYHKDGYTKHIWDYSIDYTGPSGTARELAEFAQETGRPLMLKTETGVGLEVFQFPYVPAMQRLADKWQGVRSLSPLGVHQSWLFFGMFGSRAEELGLWAAYAADMPRDDFLRAMAVRDFGPCAADLVMESWQHMSDAVGHLPLITLIHYYVGPSFLGPAHPLLPSADAAIPDEFYGYLFYLQELGETFSRKPIGQTRTCLVMNDLSPGVSYAMIADNDGDPWPIVVREYTAAAELAESAWRSLESARKCASTAQDVRNLREEMLLTELIYRTFRSCENTVKFLLARRSFDAEHDTRHMEEMKRIARLERENALAAIPIYEAAPWLDVSRRIDGRFTPSIAMIRRKVEIIDAFLET